MSDGIMPEDAITQEEEIEELLAHVNYYDDVIDMLQDRLEDIGEDTCICPHCLNNWRAKKGVTVQ